MASRPISPTEPIKKYPPPVQPNAHPYAIKTTSSALLSRSNSSPHSAHHARHHYPPSQTKSGARHRHSSSLSLVEREVHGVKDGRNMQAPQVASPDSVSLERAEGPNPRGAETMPSSAAKPTSSSQASRPELYAGLPSNPKQWNTDELITYLETSFKLNNNANGDKYDSSLVGVFDYVRARGFTGRELLQLTDTDLIESPLSDVQRAQLLDHSHTLRADALRGRIHVDLYHPHEVSDNSQDVYTRSAHSFAPSHIAHMHGCSASVDDLHTLLDDNTGGGQSIPPPSPVLSLHLSSSVSDASAQRYRDLARMRTRRRGRVKGLVETWERVSTSGSECSASEGESESETGPGLKSTTDAKHSPAFPFVLPHSPRNVPSQSACSSTEPSPVDPQEPSSTLPPYIHMHSSEAIGNIEDEPSIEELLALSSDTPLKGARAWEADFHLGDTVKRVSVPGSVGGDRPIPLITEQGVSHSQDNGHQAKSYSTRSTDSGMQRDTGIRGKRVKAQKRVVGAIFTGSSSDEVPGNLGDGARLDRQRYASCSPNGVCKVPAHSCPQNDSDNVLRALEESIAVTRAQLEMYKLRLEKIEADTARYEAMFSQAQSSDSCRFSEFGLRQERLAAGEKTTTDTTEAPRSAFTAGARNRNVLEGRETLSLVGISRVIVARAIGWLVPYGRMSTCVPVKDDESPAHSDSYSEDSNRNLPPGRRYDRLSVACMSCNLILFSFTICAAVLRRMGLGRWVSRP